LSCTITEIACLASLRDSGAIRTVLAVPPVPVEENEMHVPLALQ